ncbi:MAG TPA: hydroxyisourate hydrolase [Candidatus Angelobacter sp.]|jgi:5-hydroxyisourate hydrolase|nr:hydroxyisourate hydrolase [Candidatus Angelobacter sp.]
MISISTHVLNTAVGGPARAVPVVLMFREDATKSWKIVGRGLTDVKGRLQDFISADFKPVPGIYCLNFDSKMFSPFFPEITVQFIVMDTEQHYHVPLLVSEFGFTTYRGA